MNKQLLYFGSSWCKGCKVTTPIVNKLILEGLPIRKVDVGMEQHLADKYHVMSLPTFVVEEEGKPPYAITRVQHENAIRELLN